MLTGVLIRIVNAGRQELWRVKELLEHAFLENTPKLRGCQRHVVQSVGNSGVTNYQDDY